MRRTPRSPTAGIIENVMASRAEALAAPDRITSAHKELASDIKRLRLHALWDRRESGYKDMLGRTVEARALALRAELLERVAMRLETVESERRAA